MTTRKIAMLTIAAWLAYGCALWYVSSLPRDCNYEIRAFGHCGRK